MKRTYSIIIISILVVAIAAYLYVHFAVLKIKDLKPGDAKPQSDIDFRPLIIAKLQRLVKDGSNGLYNLSIEKLEPDILQSQLNIIHATLVPDTAALTRIDNAKKAPDNVFKISFDSLHIAGITPEDFLHKDKIVLDSVFITEPIIEVYHRPRSYNEAQRKRDDTATLYQRLSKQFKTISVNAITVRHGTLIHKDLSHKNKNTRFNDVSLDAKNLLIDSSTQFDKNRFLFAKEAELSCKDYVTRTPDSMYFFKIGSISLHATKHTMVAKQVSLEPRYNKEEFEKKLPSRDDRLDMKFPNVVANKIDWRSLVNDEIFFAEEADIYDARIKDYIDMSVPVTLYPRMDNFPSQLFLRVPLKIKIDKLNVHNMNVVSEEYNPTTKRSSNIYFDKVHGTLKNLTNLSAAIKKNKNVSFSGSCLFMHQIPCKCSFRFDLSKYQTGDFSVDLHMAALDKTVLNPFTEPLSLFTVKSGSMQEATTHLEGNNFTTSCKLLMLYNDLHITPLKPDDNDSSKLKKKSVMSFFANKFFIKNANPSHGDTPRYSEVIVQRAHNGFFNFVWKTILTSILKTVGIPLKYANK